MKTTLQLIFLFLVGSISAQDDAITMTPNVFEYEITGDQEVKIGYVLTNNRDSEVTWYWDVTIPDDFPKDWTVQVCDQTLCWSEGTLRTPLGGDNNNILAAGEATNPVFTYVQVNSKGVAGEGVLKFCVYDNADFENPVRCSDFFTSTTFENNLESINLYPNPAADYFQLSEVSGVAKIDLYNIVGSKVASYEYDDNKAYDISTLRNGLYVARLVGDDGRLLKSVRLSKRQ